MSTTEPVMEQEDVCRICQRNQEEAGGLIRPCKCRGSIMQICPKCLKVENRMTGGKCSICNETTSGIFRKLAVPRVRENEIRVPDDDWWRNIGILPPIMNGVDVRQAHLVSNLHSSSLMNNWIALLNIAWFFVPFAVLSASSWMRQHVPGTATIVWHPSTTSPAVDIRELRALMVFIHIVGMSMFLIRIGVDRNINNAGRLTIALLELVTLPLVHNLSPLVIPMLCLRFLWERVAFAAGMRSIRNHIIRVNRMLEDNAEGESSESDADSDE